MSTLVNIADMDKVTLKEALELFKTKTALANAMGVTLAAVSKLKDPLSARIEARIAMAMFRHSVKANDASETNQQQRPMNEGANE